MSAGTLPARARSHRRAWIARSRPGLRTVRRAYNPVLTRHESPECTVALLIRIDSRFNGPPDSGNGGYTTGLIAAAVGAPVRVRLLQPPPLEQDLSIMAVADDRWEVRHGSTPVATATKCSVDIEVPSAVSVPDACAASERYVGFGTHCYPTCFVCGPARSKGDGLRIFAGSMPGRSLVAAPWVPDRTLGDGDGNVRPEFIWSVLDCPGYWSSASPNPALLGELAVRIDRNLRVGERCVIAGWPIRVEGRKHFVGTAVFNADGQCCAAGAATWIILQS